MWKEQKAVSVVIGTILMFAIMTSLYVSVQVTQVPIWNQQLEQEYFEETYNDLLSLKADIGQVALSEAPKATAVSLGARYPNRPFFFNASPGRAGSLTKESTNITVQYVIDIAGDPSFTLTYPSSRLIYEMGGSIGAKIVYEHGLIIRDYGGGWCPPTNRRLW